MNAKRISVFITAVMLIIGCVVSVVSQVQAADRNVIITLDPGHGGEDPGSGTNNPMCERDLNLKIAQYCKEELETYDNVTVYMTRYDNTDTSLGTKSASLRKRAEIASNYHSDILVSLHCNAGGGRGAEVWYPNSSTYHQEFNSWGSYIADLILNQLSALGLRNRGKKIRDCTDNERYPDGSLADYYTVMNTARRYGVLCLIVEHAFVDTDDYNNFLNTDEKLKNLGVADATALAQNFALQKKGPPFTAGDLNYDGEIDVRDLIALEKQVASGAELTQKGPADVNGDGVLDQNDIVALKKILIGV